MGMDELELDYGMRHHFLLAVTWEATQCVTSHNKAHSNEPALHLGWALAPWFGRSNNYCHNWTELVFLPI